MPPISQHFNHHTRRYSIVRLITEFHNRFYHNDFHRVTQLDVAHSLVPWNDEECVELASAQREGCDEFGSVGSLYSSPTSLTRSRFGCSVGSFLLALPILVT